MRSPLGFGIREASPASRRGSSTPGWVLHSRHAQAFEEIALKMLQGNSFSKPLMSVSPAAAPPPSARRLRLALSRFGQSQAGLA